MRSDLLLGIDIGSTTVKCVLVDRDTGLEVRPLVVDENTGRPLDVRRVRVAPAPRRGR